MLKSKEDVSTMCRHEFVCTDHDVNQILLLDRVARINPTDLCHRTSNHRGSKHNIDTTIQHVKSGPHTA